MGGGETLGWFGDARVLRFFEQLEARPDVTAFRAVVTTLAAPPPGGSVLDVGCGVGAMAQCLAHYAGPLGTVIGIDGDTSLLEFAARRATGPVRFERGRAEQLSFPDDEFDYVISNWMLTRVAEPEVVVKELVRVCKPGGHVVLLDVDAASLSVDVGEPELVQEVLTAAYGAMPLRQSGFALRGRLVRVGCAEVGASPYVFSFTRWRDVAGLIPEFNRDLPSRLPVPADVQAEWWEALQRADEAGELLVSLTAWAAAGRKPQAPRR